MSIDRNDCDERQARLDRMIDEFRKAQSRRLSRTPGKVLESRVETAGTVIVDVSVTNARPPMDGNT